MLRRISTKLVLAVLLAVVLPFVAFSFYVNEQMADRLTRHVVQQALLGLVKDLAGQIDRFVEDRRSDLEWWANTPVTHAAMEAHVAERARLRRARRGEPGTAAGPVWNAETLTRWARDRRLDASELDLRSRLQSTLEFDRGMDLKVVYNLLLLVSEDGSLVTCSSGYNNGNESTPLERDFLEYLFAYDYSGEGWFREVLEGESFARVDHHVSPFHVQLASDGFDDTRDPAFGYQLGFAVPVRTRESTGVRGVLYALVSWKYVQDLVSSQVIADAFSGLVEEADQSSPPYAWLWAEDADTILAHRDRELYYKRVSEDIGLSELTAAVRASQDGWGLYPEYTFAGGRKNAAFARCKSSLAGGFGWVVGVGINNDDIFATADELRSLLLNGTVGVMLLAVCWTLFIARRTTAPVRELQRHARRVAEGDLDVRSEIRSSDELGALAEDFNRMTADLKTQRERIVKAEKDAAWREMARQIAHDIKNPLTPITLSLDLLERARRDRHQGSEEILERTMGLMRRQVENLREIAQDFYEFTGGRKAKPAEVALAPMLDEVLHLHDAWAVERGVTIQREGPDAVVWADAGKLRRVLVNLVSNALQAMPDGGALEVETVVDGEHVEIRIRDTGVGIAAEARAHLFEPYFTTKSEGTGLGLAIARRSVEEMGGEIELVEAPDGAGTVARVRLPLMAERG